MLKKISKSKIIKNVIPFLFFLLFYQIDYSQDNIETQRINKFKYYKEKYKVNQLSEKITDNFGNGFDSLYGTRNMRTILFGVAYRGGANNFYHKFNKRDNHNPLPEDGLQNLARQGFSAAIYLYSTNFKESPKVIINHTTADTLHYFQNSGNDRQNLKKIMYLILDIINNPDKGPVYLHCWNGWHQSGYISAAILMQYCNFTNEQAYKYWLENTDGVNKGYENVKNLIRNFKPFDDININNSIKKEICPCLNK
jgi:hypothetical protein